MMSANQTPEVNLPPLITFQVKGINIKPGDKYNVEYEGGDGVFNKVIKNKAYNELFPDINKPPVDYGGWKKGKPCYPLVFRNDGNWDVLIVKFYNYETAEKFVYNYNKQFFK